MASDRLYVGTDVYVDISLDGDISIVDISDLQIKLVKDDMIITLSQSNGDITIVGSKITLKIARGSVVEHGSYDIYMTAITSSGDHLGLTTFPLDLFFHNKI